MTAQSIPPDSSSAVNLTLHSPEQIAQLMQVLDEWIADESGYEESTWAELTKALDQERDATKARRLFA
jgi:hypothetical protein